MNLEETKTEKKKEDSYDLGFQHYWLVELRGLAALALKHIGTVKGEKIPQDIEFREQLFVLLRGINVAAQKLEESYGAIEVPTAYREED